MRKNLMFAVLLALAAFTVNAVDVIVVTGGAQVTACKKATQSPMTSWIEILPEYLAGDAKFINWAGGRSTRILLESGYWKKHVARSVAPDRYFIISFGIEDASYNRKYRTDAATEFKKNLETIIRDVENGGALPLLVSPVIRCTHGGADRRTLSDNELFGYAKAMGEVAKENGVGFVDLTKATYDHFKKMPPEEMRKYFMFYAPGEEKNYPSGIRNISMTNDKGARVAADLFVRMAKKQQLPISGLFK